MTMLRKAFMFLLLFPYLFSGAQLNPVITSWVINTTGATGYNSLPSNVQKVQYDASDVYISASCIPGYDIGPWQSNPNIPVNENFVYKLPLNPQQNTGALTTVPLGHTGVWSNGISIFNANDAQTYNNAGVWYRNAYFFEGISFDTCLGHPAPNGEYHNHVNPRCLYDAADSTHHSPIIGYMLDGYPMYGAYGYANTDGTGGIKRMTPSYQLRNITTRTTDPYGNTASSAGPAVGGSYPIGSFLWDYEYLAGSGDLDSNNGRFCKTPEYPNGTYAYFVTIDSNLTPVYPYTSGTHYYGVVIGGNTGPQGGHNTPPGATTTYTPDTATAIASVTGPIAYKVLPNPTSGYVYIYFDAGSPNNVKGELYSVDGKMLQSYPYLQPSIAYSIDLTAYPAGTYMLRLISNNQSTVEKLVKLDK